MVKSDDGFVLIIDALNLFTRHFVAHPATGVNGEHVGGIVGMGNISGVAIAIIMGGPGAIFWMWVTAFFGMITKFYTCSLAVMYRDKKEGQFVGGPMYVNSKGL